MNDDTGVCILLQKMEYGSKNILTECICSIQASQAFNKSSVLRRRTVEELLRNCSWSFEKPKY